MLSPARTRAFPAARAKIFSVKVIEQQSIKYERRVRNWGFDAAALFFGWWIERFPRIKTLIYVVSARVAPGISAAPAALRPTGLRMYCLSLTRSRLAAAGALLAAALGCAAPALLAGERIIIGNNNSSFAADQPLPKQDFEKTDANFWRKSMANPGGASPPAFAPPPANSDPGEEKRLRQKQNEKRWWLMLAPGDLQKDAKSPSLETSAPEDRNTLSRSGDYTFYGLGGDQRHSSKDTTRRAGDRETRRRETEAEEEETNSDSHRVRNRLSGNSEFEPGARADQGGGIWKGVFAPNQTSALPESDMTLRDIFTGLNPSRFSTEQELQKNLRLDGPASLSGISETSEPFTLGASWSGKAAVPAPPAINPPAMNQSREIFAGAPAGANAFGPRLPDSSTDLGGLRQQMPGLGSSTPLLAPSGSQVSRPTVMGGSLFNRDAPVRGGL